MKDKDKTSEQMTKELMKVRQRIAEMEASETEHKRIEDALRFSTERLQALLDTAPVVICQSDLTTKITYVNKKFEEVTGYKREEVVGKPWFTLGILSRESARLIRNRMIEKLKGSPPTPMEVQVRRKDGQLIWVTGIGEIIWERSKPVGFHTVAQEVTDYKLAQQKIQRAAEEWRTTFDTIPDLVSIHDKNFKIVRLNKAFARTCRLKPQAVVGSTCYELIHGTKEPWADCPLRQALATRKPSRSEFFNPHLGIYTEVTCSPILNGNGDATASVHVIRDVTERRQMLGTLQESEERYRLVADNAADVIWTVDLNMRPTYVSPSVTRLLGYSVEEAMAKPMEEVFTPASQKLAMEALAEELAIEELEQKDLFRSRLLELHMVHKDSSTVPVEIKYTFLRDADTKPVGVLAIARDITKRKQVEAKLKESESKYRAIFETTGTAMIIIEEDTTISLANTEFEKLSGYSKKEIEGKKSWAEFVLKGDLEKMKAYHRWRRIDSATSPKHYEFQLVDRKGNIKDVYASVDIIPGTRRSVASILDMSERKQMEQQLIVADRLATLGELVSGVAHELNNPLTSIIGFAQLLLAKDIPGGIKEDLNVIYQEAERTSKVVRNLLTFARKHEPEKKPVNLNEAIEVVLALRTYEQKVHNIQVNTRFAPDLPEIMADGFQLQQVFLNIIINAEFFMTSAHGGGNLNITTERVGDNIRASFTDDGAGIPQENLSRLFDPFFTTKDVGKGTGLGLSICHGIVTEHGGSIYAESEPSKSATFIIELPIS